MVSVGQQSFSCLPPLRRFRLELAHLAQPWQLSRMSWFIPGPESIIRGVQKYTKPEVKPVKLLAIHTSHDPVTGSRLSILGGLLPIL